MTKGKSDKQYILGALFTLLFAVGVTAGALFCAYTGADSDKSLYDYLQNFFAQFTQNTNNAAVVKRAIMLNTRIFAVIFLAGFFTVGAVAVGVCVAAKGFVMGFTAAAFVKYYGVKGVWLSMCGLPSGLILIPTMIFLAVTSVSFSKNSAKKEKGVVGTYIILSAVIFALFCMSAVFDGFLTSALMKKVVENAINMPQ